MAYSSCITGQACASRCRDGQRPSLRRLEFGHVLPYLSESSLQHHAGRVEVAVQGPPAAPAVEGADAERDLVEHPAETALLGRVRRRDPDHELPRSSGFVFREAPKLTPTGVCDGLGEGVVPEPARCLDHPRQPLHLLAIRIETEPESRLHALARRHPLKAPQAFIPGLKHLGFLPRR